MSSTIICACILYHFYLFIDIHIHKFTKKTYDITHRTRLNRHNFLSNSMHIPKLSIPNDQAYIQRVFPKSAMTWLCTSRRPTHVRN